MRSLPFVPFALCLVVGGHRFVDDYFAVERIEETAHALEVFVRHDPPPPFRVVR